MAKFVATAKRVLWEFVEIAFLAVLALLLIFLLLGKDAGPYVVSVADNVTKFAAASKCRHARHRAGAGDHLLGATPREDGQRDTLVNEHGSGVLPPSSGSGVAMVC